MWLVITVGTQVIGGTSGGVADGGVTTAKIASAAVTTAKIADGGVTTAKIADANVTTAKITDANVTTSKIADTAVATAKLADAAVTTAKVADGAVTAAKIAANAVTLAKLDAATLGLVETTVALPIAPGQRAAPTSGSEVIGLVYFLPSRYAVTGLTTTLSIEAIGYVESGCTLTLDVLDVTAGFTGASSALGAPVTWTETDPTRKTASITLPGSGKIYAATISKNTSAGAYLSALNLLVARS